MLHHFSLLAIVCFVSLIFLFKSSCYHAFWFIGSVIEIRYMQISVLAFFSEAFLGIMMKQLGFEASVYIYTRI